MRSLNHLTPHPPEAVADCVRFAIPHSTERQRIGDQIHAALVFTWPRLRKRELLPRSLRLRSVFESVVLMQFGFQSASIPSCLILREGRFSPSRHSPAGAGV